MEQLARSKEEAQQSADAARIGKRQAEETARQTLEQATSEAAAQAVSRMEKKMAQATQREIAAAVAAALKEHDAKVENDMRKLSEAARAAELEVGQKREPKSPIVTDYHLGWVTASVHLLIVIHFNCLHQRRLPGRQTRRGSFEPAPRRWSESARTRTAESSSALTATSRRLWWMRIVRCTRRGPSWIGRRSSRRRPPCGRPRLLRASPVSKSSLGLPSRATKVRQAA